MIAGVVLCCCVILLIVFNAFDVSMYLIQENIALAPRRCFDIVRFCSMFHLSSDLLMSREMRVTASIVSKEVTGLIVIHVVLYDTVSPCCPQSPPLNQARHDTKETSRAYLATASLQTCELSPSHTWSPSECLQVSSSFLCVTFALGPHGQVDEMADKLDGVMLVVFTYLDQRLTANASLPPEQIMETPLLGVEGGGDAGVEADGRIGAAVAEGRHKEAGSVDGGRDKGRRSSTGGLQGMEPVARLLKVCRCLAVVCVVTLLVLVVGAAEATATAV